MKLYEISNQFSNLFEQLDAISSYEPSKTNSGLYADDDGNVIIDLEAYKEDMITALFDTLDGIEQELERKHVFVTDCTKEYEGQVKGVGDSIIIKGAGDVTLSNYADGEVHAFSTPETITGTNAIMTIKHISQFNFMVGDIDKEQGANGAVSIYTKQAAEKIANEQDILVASMAADPLALYDHDAAAQITVDNVLQTIDNGIQMLWQNDVPANERLVLTVSPRFYMILKQKYMALDTDNSEMLKRGAVAMYGNVDVKLSNNVYTSNNGAQDKIMLRTAKAIAFANPLTRTEPYRPDAYMADAIRGESLYDAKLIRPKQMVVLNCKYA